MLFRKLKPIGDQTVLITGAASGIGRATAIALSVKGAKVALVDINQSGLRATAKLCGGANYEVCDITDVNSLHSAVASLSRKVNGFDAVLAIAGMAEENALLRPRINQFDRTIEVNLCGTRNTIEAAEPYIRGRGYIMVTSSLGANIRLPLMGAYSASKAAIVAMADALDIELAGKHRVSVAIFSQLDNEMTDKFNSDAGRALFGQRGLLALHRVEPAHIAVDAILKGVECQSRRIYAPGRVRILALLSPLIQPVIRIWIGALAHDVVNISRRAH